MAGRELLGSGGREGFEQRVSELRGGCGKGGGGGGRSSSTAKRQRAGGGGGGGAATPRWSAALLGRSYTFDHSLQPPPLLLLLLRLITLPLPALRGDGWLDDEGMASEHAGLHLDEQLDRTQCELLLRAIEVQVGRYHQQKATAAFSSSSAAAASAKATGKAAAVAAVSEDVARYRRERAESLVSSQLDLWKRVQEKVGEVMRGAAASAAAAVAAAVEGKGNGQKKRGRRKEEGGGGGGGNGRKRGR